MKVMLTAALLTMAVLRAIREVHERAERRRVAEAAREQLRLWVS